MRNLNSYSPIPSKVQTLHFHICLFKKTVYLETDVSDLSLDAFIDLSWLYQDLNINAVF